jgi:hypothetical protein
VLVKIFHVIPPRLSIIHDESFESRGLFCGQEPLDGRLTQ